MPRPRAVKMASTTGPVWARAKLIAVPRNGAEQGVAISVANRPEAKWPAIPSRGPEPARLASDAGNWISNRPQRLRQKRTTITARKATKPGRWNCTPQPTAEPAARAAMAARARAQNEARMPAEVARAPRVTSARPWPALRVVAGLVAQRGLHRIGARLRAGGHLELRHDHHVAGIDGQRHLLEGERLHLRLRIPRLLRPPAGGRRQLQHRGDEVLERRLVRVDVPAGLDAHQGGDAGRLAGVVGGAVRVEDERGLVLLPELRPGGSRGQRQGLAEELQDNGSQDVPARHGDRPLGL